MKYSAAGNMLPEQTRGTWNLSEAPAVTLLCRAYRGIGLDAYAYYHIPNRPDAPLTVTFTPQDYYNPAMMCHNFGKVTYDTFGKLTTVSLGPLLGQNLPQADRAFLLDLQKNAVQKTLRDNGGRIYQEKEINGRKAAFIYLDEPEMFSAYMQLEGSNLTKAIRAVKHIPSAAIGTRALTARTPHRDVPNWSEIPDMIDVEIGIYRAAYRVQDIDLRDDTVLNQVMGSLPETPVSPFHEDVLIRSITLPPQEDIVLNIKHKV